MSVSFHSEFFRSKGNVRQDLLIFLTQESLMRYYLVFSDIGTTVPLTNIPDHMLLWTMSLEGLLKKAFKIGCLRAGSVKYVAISGKIQHFEKKKSIIWLNQSLLVGIMCLKN